MYWTIGDCLYRDCYGIEWYRFVSNAKYVRTLTNTYHTACSKKQLKQQTLTPLKDFWIKKERQGWTSSRINLMGPGLI